MKTITWDGDTRIIPKYGIAKKGKKLILPDALAESFMKQGLTKENPPAPAKEKN